MRTIGRRTEAEIVGVAQARGLVEASCLTATAVGLAGGNCPLPKGVRRFKTHEAANAWQEQVRAELMAELARSRSDA